MYSWLPRLMGRSPFGVWAFKPVDVVVTSFTISIKAIEIARTVIILDKVIFFASRFRSQDII